MSERDAILIGITNADFPHSPRLVDGLARDRDPIRYEFRVDRIDIVNEDIHRARSQAPTLKRMHVQPRTVTSERHVARIGFGLVRAQSGQGGESQALAIELLCRKWSR